MILLDTNICIGLLRGNQTVLAHYLKHTGDVAVPFMAVGELYFGAEKSDRPEENRRIVERFLSCMPIVQSTTESMKLYGSMKAALQKKGTPVEDADVLIASIALSNNVQLATGNLKHMSRFARLKLQNWFE